MRLFTSKPAPTRIISDNESEYDSDSEQEDKQFNVFQKLLCV